MKKEKILKLNDIKARNMLALLELLLAQEQLLFLLQLQLLGLLRAVAPNLDLSIRRARREAVDLVGFFLRNGERPDLVLVRVDRADALLARDRVHLDYSSVVAADHLQIRADKRSPKQLPVTSARTKPTLWSTPSIV